MLANVRRDFVRELIDYAHSKSIRVQLVITPFGYDGVNRFTFEHPELKARKPDGSPVDQFGIHCWGWNLCPAKAESQRLMREYIGEMVFEFYPNADGLLIESSDYSVCRCAECGPRYYDHEFAFVRWLSDELWRRNASALILVYPHYFTGQKVPGLNATAARQPFDSRWGLFFTPHSAHFNADLIRQAQASIFSSVAPALGTPQRVVEAARAAREHGVTGFVPSLEAFSYIATQPEGGESWVIGKRMRPFGLNALDDGRMPYRALIPRVQRFAFREFSRDPALAFPEFQHHLGKQILEDETSPQGISDLLELQRVWAYESDWYWPSPLLEPEFFRHRAQRLKWSPQKLADYNRNLDHLRAIATRHAGARQPGRREMARLSNMIGKRWGDASPLSVRPKAP